MKKSIFLFMTLLIVSTSQAQNDSVNYKHSLGLSGGVSTGLGFSYRYWPKKVGFQVTGIPILSNVEIFSSVALSGLITIKDFSNIRLFGYFGNHLIYNRNGYILLAEDPITGEVKETKVTSDRYTYITALGVGFRFNFWEILDFNLQAGYGNIFDFDSNPFRTTFAAEVGLYYHF
jgi:hypothetical protein